MKLSNHADQQYPEWEREHLKEVIDQRVALFHDHLFTARVRGKARHHGKDLLTKGAWIKAVKADFKKDMERMGCRPSFIKRAIESTDERINFNIQQLLKDSTFTQNAKGDIFTP